LGVIVLEGVTPGHHDNSLKIFLIGKDIWHLVFFLEGGMSCSRSRHLVLWSLGILTIQQRFYGMEMVKRKGRCYHPLSVLLEADYIAGFV
jgi:hypothetical protein